MNEELEAMTGFDPADLPPELLRSPAAQRICTGCGLRGDCSCHDLDRIIDDLATHTFTRAIWRGEERSSPTERLDIEAYDEATGAIIVTHSGSYLWRKRVEGQRGW